MSSIKFVSFEWARFGWIVKALRGVPMKATVFDEKRGVFQVEIGELRDRLSTDSFFWLDIDGASREELQTVTSVLQTAEPASSWLPRFGQRARFEVDGQQIRISTFA